LFCLSQRELFIFFFSTSMTSQEELVRFCASQGIPFFGPTLRLLKAYRDWKVKLPDPYDPFDANDPLLFVDPAQDYTDDSESEESDSEPDSDYDEYVFEIRVPQSSVPEHVEAVQILTNFIDELLHQTPLETKVEVLTLEQAEQNPIDVRHRGGSKIRKPKRRAKKRPRGSRSEVSLQTLRTLFHGLGYKYFDTKKFTTRRPQIQSAAVGTVAGEVVFSLADSPNLTAVQALADSFTIDKVRIRFVPCQQLVANSNSSSAVQSIAPEFAACVDTNAIGYVPSSLASVQDYANSKTVTANQPLSFEFRPAALLAGFETSTVTTFYAPNITPIRTADAATYHYGVPWFMEAVAGGTPPAGIFTYDVIVDYWVGLYNQK
jgi:hypothetical protein